VEILLSSKMTGQVDVLVLPYTKEEQLCPMFSKQRLDQEFLDYLSLVEEDFVGKAGELLLSHSPKNTIRRVLLLGLGSLKEQDALTSIRQALAQVVSFCRNKRLSSVHILWGEKLNKEQFTAALDGLHMANYSYDHLKGTSLRDKPTFLIEKVEFIGGKKEWSSVIAEQHALMLAVNLTRNLVNGNADEVHAQELVRIAKELTKKFSSLHVKTLGKKALEEEGMGLMLAVNQAAHREPAFILLEYRGDPSSSEQTVFLGKGVTFDTGGLNLKPTGSMETMKTDMAGAAAVLGAMQAIAALKLKKNVLGVVASVENAIGHGAYKPGDVYKSHAGITVEISNTDAEGRLILADALSYIQKHYTPSRIIDLATLTGGIIVAIGEEASGLFSNEEKLVQQLQQAADKTGERVWHMPLFSEYRKQLQSSLADMKNAGTGRRASPCIGAIFLQRFVEKNLPWAHLDIAGTAYVSEATSYHPSCATGVGVKLLVAFLQGLS